ncbi:hypothetical protein HY734_03090 [Candidatus Uhrbacteria bacterium]|nr:hypothetical protein [Candidatus Uhrbacteria bacterium]
MENLLEAWQEFVKGKRSRDDVQAFERSLMENLFSLHTRLTDMTYRHAPYQAFIISDPKTRHIHKASVADRVLHRALYRRLYPFFDRTFIADSFSCRMGKGTHKALDRFNVFARKVSQNHRKTVWVLTCDIRKFFASIDQRVLLTMLDGYIADKRIVRLLETILQSFSSGIEGIGLPLGNLTSQMLANVYLNAFDQFVKHRLRVKLYIRYADDFVLFSEHREYLENILEEIDAFLFQRLRLSLHPRKIELRSIASGIDFLGWVHFPHYRVLRTSTKRKMLKNLKGSAKPETLASYLGLLRHGDTYELSQQILEGDRAL